MPYLCILFVINIYRAMNNARLLTALLSALIIFRTSRTELLVICSAHPFYGSLLSVAIYFIIKKKTSATSDIKSERAYIIFRDLSDVITIISRSGC